MPLTKATYSMVDGAPANVLDFGATGDGVTDDTSAVQLALNSGKTLVYFPEGTYVIGDVFAPSNSGVKIVGPGKIKFTGLASTGLSVSINSDSPDINNINSMFVHNARSIGDMATIKSLGYETITHYLQFAAGESGTIQQVLDSAYAVGIRVILASQTDTPTLSFDSHPALFGYYLFDEPSTNGVSVLDQETRIAAHRALTAKPLCIADFGDFNLATPLASEWDIVFVDVYYNKTNTNYNTDVDLSNKATALISWESTKLACPHARVIPCVGLFGQTGTAADIPKNIAFAKEYARFSVDQSICVFGWDLAQVYPMFYDFDCSSSQEYRDAAIEMPFIVKGSRGWQSKVYYWQNTSDISDLMQVYNEKYSSNNILPFAVINGTGSEREQSFGPWKGLAARDVGGFFASTIKTEGCVWWRYRWRNFSDGNPGTIVTSETSEDYYTKNALKTQVIDNNSTATAIEQSDGKLLGINITYTGTSVNLWKFLTASIIVSNWDTTSF
jgi:hypothetical protein